MATRHYIDAGVNCVFIEHVGEIVCGEGPANLAEILRDPAFRPGMNFFPGFRQHILANRIRL